MRVAVGARWIGHTAADMPSLVVAEEAGLGAEKPEITVLVVSGGVVLPVVQEQPVIDPIDEPGRDEGVDELIGVAIPACSLGDFGVGNVPEITVALNVIQRPPPQLMEVAYEAVFVRPKEAAQAE